MLSTLNQTAGRWQSAENSLCEGCEELANFPPSLTRLGLIETLCSFDLYTTAVQTALSQACKSHKNKIRDDGRSSYLNQHIFPIVFRIIKIYHSYEQIEDMIIVALLHDAIEDDDSFTEDVCRGTFGDRITKLLLPLSKKHISQTSELHGFALAALQITILRRSNIISRIVKLEDRLNNITSSFNKQKKEKYAEYIEETRRLFYALALTVSRSYFDLLSEEVTLLEMRVARMEP